MSGTSLDGIDLAIVDLASSQANVIHCETSPYPKNVVTRLRQLNLGQNLSFDSLYSADVELGELYAQTVNAALKNQNIEADHIRAIGCHGQTLYHKPAGQFPYTVQIGDPNVIAARTGIDTVADFRRKDVALGGQGAPLAPLFHNYLFGNSGNPRIVVNIGGIANISCLSPGDPPMGFDTGPGNTFMDYWISLHHSETFDSNGDWAAGGEVQPALLQSMIETEPYFKAAPPKTTGTEYFNPDWLAKHNPGDFSPRDVQATLCELTAQTLCTDIKTYFPQYNECYVCGGGALNQHLLSRIQTLLGGAPVSSIQSLGVDPLFVEAIGFAWLASQRIHGKATDLPSVTGSTRGAVLGGLYSAS